MYLKFCELKDYLLVVGPQQFIYRYNSRKERMK